MLPTYELFLVRSTFRTWFHWTAEIFLCWEATTVACTGIRFTDWDLIRYLVFWWTITETDDKISWSVKSWKIRLPCRRRQLRCDNRQSNSTFNSRWRWKYYYSRNDWKFWFLSTCCASRNDGWILYLSYCTSVFAWHRRQ